MSEAEEREEAMFEAALRLSIEQRAVYLGQACGADTNLRQRVVALLAAFERASGFLKKPVVSIPTPTLPRVEGPGDRIGRYKLLQQIGEGGMGVVYMAEQEEPVRRRVALKIIKLGMDTKQVVARFEAERQALALMDHPNIARVLDGGATDAGRPYFVMELVQGVPITEFCDKNQLSMEERLKLFLPVCQAIQSAHQKGIIHRDLKPSNILVTLNPDGSGLPKVIDFGVAKAINQKLTEKTVFTNYPAMVGTPAYMSPEQAEMSHLDVDTRADIYGLGVLLYELLTGTTPFPEKRLRSAGYNEMQRIILHEEPERPSTRLSTLQGQQRSIVARNRGASEPTLGRAFPSDLDWIVMKCLEKDRTRRYETANGLARDLERHLKNEPIVARPPSTAYRVQKFVRRNKLAVSAATAVGIVLMLGILVSTLEAIRATRLRQQAQANERKAIAAQAQESEQRQSAQRHLYAAKMNLAQAAWEQNHVGRLREILEETATYPERGFEWYYWQRQTHLELRTLRGHLGQVWGVAFSPDGGRLATASFDRTAKVWDAASGAELLTLTGHLAGVSSVAFSPDGRRIITGSLDATARIWDPVDGREIRCLKGHHSDVCAVAFSPDGQRIVTGSTDRTAKVWDPANGSNLLTLNGHTLDVNTVAFSPDGRRLLTASDDHIARVWDAFTGTILFTLEGPSDTVESAAFSPDGQRIAIGREDKTIKVYDALSGKELLTLAGHRGRIRGVAFSPDGQRIASGSSDQTAKVWDATSGRELFTLQGHNDYVPFVAFSPNGRRIVTAGSDNTAKIWEAAADREPLTLRGHTDQVQAVAFSQHGERMLTGGSDGALKLWETASGKLLRTLEAHGPIRAAAFSPEGRWIATGNQDQTAELWDTATGAHLFTLTGHSGSVTSVAFSPDGQRLLTASADHTVRAWETASGKYLSTLHAHNDGVFAVAFAPDGRRLATGGNDDTVRLWDAASDEPPFTLSTLGANNWVASVAFSPDGRQIAAGCADGTARLWDASTRRELLTLKGHSAEVMRVAFSPDARRIVTASYDQTAKVWDAVSGEELLTLKGHTNDLYAVAFSPDGQRIATSSGDLTAKIWQAATAGEVARWQKEEQDASERLAAWGRERHAAAQHERARRAQDPGVVKQWLVLAPLHFTNQSGAAALDCEQLPDEAHLHPQAGEPVHASHGGQVWRAVEPWDYVVDFGILNLSRFPRSLAYAVSYIQTETDQHNLCLKIGSFGQSKVYLNGKEIYRWGEVRAFVPDQDLVTNVELNAGLNLLVFKLAVEELNDQNWQGSIRFTDAAGRPVKGIRATITPASQNPGAVHDWLLLAPITFEGTNGTKTLAQEQIPDEAHLRPRAGDRTCVGGTSLVWQDFHLNDYGLDFLELTGKTNADWCVAYAVCYIESHASQTNLIMKVGSDDQAKVYLNGKEIYQHDEPRAMVPDQDEVSGVELKAGLNVLVFKVVNEQVDWRGSIRFTDAAGQPVKGLRVTLSPPPSTEPRLCTGV